MEEEKINQCEEFDNVPILIEETIRQLNDQKERFEKNVEELKNNYRVNTFEQTDESIEKNIERAQQIN